MLHTDTHCKALCLKFAALALEHFVNVAGRMTGRQNDGFRLVCQCLIIILFIDGSNSDDAVFSPFDIRNPVLEMIFSAMFNDTFADVADKSRKLVGSDMRMRIHDNGRVCSKIHELIEDLAVVATLGRTCKELAVRECACSTLAIAIVGIRVHDTRA